MKRGYMYLALLGLETALREMADESGLVLLSNRKIAVKLQVGQRQLNEMITELVEEGRVYKTRGLVKINGSVKDSNGSVKEPYGSVTDARHERDHERLRDHALHVSLKEKKKEEEEEVDRRRRLKFFEENTELKVLWATYRHNPGTNPNRDKDESIELWPKVVDHLGMSAIIEHFEKLDESAIRCDKSTRFVEQLNRLMSRIVL
jgi:rRNA processing protein Gar1